MMSSTYSPNFARLLFEASLLASLEGCSGIPQTKGHQYIAEGAKRGDEGHHMLVGQIHHDLVVP
jgi:hypothetical protein